MSKDETEKHQLKKRKEQKVNPRKSSKFELIP